MAPQHKRQFNPHAMKAAKIERPRPRPEPAPEPAPEPPAPEIKEATAQVSFDIKMSAIRGYRPRYIAVNGLSPRQQLGLCVLQQSLAKHEALIQRRGNRKPRPVVNFADAVRWMLETVGKQAEDAGHR